MIKQRVLVYLLVLLIGLAACGLILLAPSLPGIFADYKASSAFDIYPGSEKIYEAVDDYPAAPNSDIKKRYYWSKDSVNIIRTYYEGMGYKFRLGQDKNGEWLIAGFDRHNNVLQTSENTGPIVHSSFCLNAADQIHLKPELDCYTLALIDASQPEIYELTVSLPTSSRPSTLPTEMATIPPYGTVIILTYYREDIW